MRRKLKSKEVKRTRKKLKLNFEAGKILYWSILIIIPLVISTVTGIVDTGDDAITKSFFILTFIIYVTGLMLIYPILNIWREFKIILKEYNKTISTNILTNSEKYEELKDIVDYYKLNTAEKIFEKLNRSLKIKKVVNEDGEYNTYYLSTEADYFFNEDNVIYKNIPMKVINQITQSLTGIGIFGTFLGIIRGVSGLNLANNDYIRDSIIVLLSGIKVSFNSSLYGIMFSMILVMTLKIILDITMKKVYRVSEEIEKIMNFYTHENYLQDLVCEIKNQSCVLNDILRILKNKDIHLAGSYNDDFISNLK